MVPRQDHRGRVHFHHDRRTGDAIAGLELRAVVHRRHAVLADHVRLLLADGRGGRRRAAPRDDLALDVDALALHHGAQCDELVLERQREREEPRVLLVERLADRVEAFLLEALQVDVHGEAQALAVVAHVHLVGELHVLRCNLLARERLGRVGRQRLQLLGDVVLAGLGELADVGARGFVANCRGCVAQRAQHARARRNDRRPGTQQDRQRIGVQRAGAAERDQRVVARIVALLDRDEAQRADHVLVDDVVDAERGVLGILAERLADLFHRLLRELAVERHVAAQLLQLGEIAEHDVRVGHRGFGAALAVRGRTGIGTRRLRTHAQRAGEFRHVGNRAATRAHRADVHRRGTHRDVAHRGLATQPRLPVHDQRDVGRRAADVHGEQVREARLHRTPQRAGHAARRAGHQQVDREVLGRLRRGEATVGTQDVQLDALGRGAELGLQVVHVLLHARTHVGIGDGGDGALVLLHLGHDLGRQRHRNARQDLLRDLLDAALVLVVGERVDQRDGERFDVLRAEGAQFVAQLRFVQRRDHVALGADALVRLDRQRERRHRQRLVVDDPAAEAARHEAACDLQHLPIALGGDEAHARAGAREHRVGRDGGAVHDVVDFLGGDRGEAADALDAAQHALRLVVRRGGHLGLPRLPRLFVHQQQVGEGPAHVDAESVSHAVTCCVRSRQAAAVAGLGNPPAFTSMPGTLRPSCSCSHLPVSIAASSETPVW